MKTLISLTLALVSSGASAQQSPPGAPYGYEVARVPASLAHFEGDLGEPLFIATVCDDCAEQTSLPFTFEYFNQRYTSAWVSSNGTVDFRGDDASPANYSKLVRARVALMPAWDDWQVCGGAVLEKRLPDRVVYTWATRRYPCGGDPGRANFQAVLFRDGRIQFNYGEVTSRTDAHVALAMDDGRTVMPIVGYPASTSSRLDRIDSFVFTPDVAQPPPVTTILVEPPLVPGERCHRGPATVTLAAVDPAPYSSGVRDTFYLFADDGFWRRYAGPLTVTYPGPEVFCAYSVDSWGTEESPPKCLEICVR